MIGGSRYADLMCAVVFQTCRWALHVNEAFLPVVLQALKSAILGKSPQCRHSGLSLTSRTFLVEKLGQESQSNTSPSLARVTLKAENLTETTPVALTMGYS